MCRPFSLGTFCRVFTSNDYNSVPLSRYALYLHRTQGDAAAITDFYEQAKLHTRRCVLQRMSIYISMRRRSRRTRRGLRPCISTFGSCALCTGRFNFKHVHTHAHTHVSTQAIHMFITCLYKCVSRLESSAKSPEYDALLVQAPLSRDSKDLLLLHKQ